MKAPNSASTISDNQLLNTSLHSRYSEDSLIEQSAIELFQKLGWNVANCFDEVFSTNGTLGRETAAEVVLVSRYALAKLNPELPADAIKFAIEELTRDRSAMSAAEANRQIYKLLRDGVRADVTEAVIPGVDKKRAGRAVGRVKVIDWDNPQL